MTTRHLTQNISSKPVADRSRSCVRTPVASAFFAAAILLITSVWSGNAQASDQPTKFKRIHTQFIAALGDPESNAGSGAQDWGLWRVDPGPRGVWLARFDDLEEAGGVAPAKWQFDNSDWWLDENGLIMEKPEFPVGPGKYVVTGDREVTTILTIHPADDTGDQRWELDDGAKLFDVTHLPCRSARYTPATDSDACSPASANRSDFRVDPGASMPVVNGCNKQDYAVLFVIGVAVNNPVNN